MKKVFAGMLLVLLAAQVFAGGKNDSGSSGVRVIRVGTEGAYPPYNYVDKDGKADGYDIAVVRAVDELLPQYEFSFETSDFAGILVGLDAGKYDIAAHWYAKNAQRAERYLYGLTPYSSYAYQIAVKAGRKDIQSIKDLEGKSVAVSTGSNVSYLLENYNQNSATVPIQLIYGSLDDETWVRGLDEGRFDGFIASIKSIADVRKAFNNRIEGVGTALLPGYTYYVFSKKDTQLRDDVDKALDTLRASGKLREFNLKRFVQDYSELIPELEAERAQDIYREKL
jgi:ABC-type amino acid transport substrate-binding protein